MFDKCYDLSIWNKLHVLYENILFWNFSVKYIYILCPFWEFWSFILCNIDLISYKENYFQTGTRAQLLSDSVSSSLSNILYVFSSGPATDITYLGLHNLSSCIIFHWHCIRSIAWYLWCGHLFLAFGDVDYHYPVVPYRGF